MRKFRWGFPGLLTWLVLAGGTQLAGTPQDASPLPDLPKVAFENLSPALRAKAEEAHRAVLAQPRDAAANGRLGEILHAADLYSAAENCFERAHRFDPASFRWAYFLAIAQEDVGKLDAAIETLRKALELDAAYLPARLRLGANLLATGRWPEAAQIYEAILAKDPRHPIALYGVGRVRAARKNLEGAVAAFKQAVEVSPNYGAARYALAQTYKRLGQMDQAFEQLSFYESSRSAAPDPGDQLWREFRVLGDSPIDEIRRATELAAQGKTADAVAIHERIVQADPSLVEAHVNLILLYGQLGDFARGEEHFFAARRLKPNHAGAYFNHGLLLVGQGQFSAAEREFRRALEISPNHSDAHAKLGLTLEAQNRLAEAAAEFRTVVESNPDSLPARFNLGRILVNQGNYKEGIQHLQKCLRTEDEEIKPSYLYALGAAYGRSGDGKNALHYMRLAREGALARSQSQLVASIDADMETLRNQGTPQPR